MEVTVENNLIDPDSAIEINVERHDDDSGNRNEGIILNESDSVNSEDAIALSPLQTSIDETGKALNSAG